MRRQVGRGPAEQGSSFGLDDARLAFFSLALTIVVVVAASLISGIVYHSIYHDGVGPIGRFATAGVLVAALFKLPFLLRGEVTVQSYIQVGRPVMRLAAHWLYAFVALGAIAFVTKSSAEFSRGWVLLLLVCGLVGVLALEHGLARLIRIALAQGHISPRRLLVLGTDAKIETYKTAFGSGRSGFTIVAFAEVPQAAHDPAISKEDRRRIQAAALDRAVLSARRLEIDDVVVLADWGDTDYIEHCVEALSLLPVTIQLDTGRFIERFSDLRIKRIGRVAALSLTEPPLAPLQALAKRCIDVAIASLALLMLSPFFAVIALAIKADSKGPVMFRQRRVGYNQRQFRIFQFRSMSTLDDGDTVVQAKRGDARVTRVGAWLRRFNIDELPQLLNVLKGEMSIVGPRPHALAHGRLFEQQVRKYPRRLNVLPGITGWAQVNGYRGETDTEEKIHQRVEHDLYYIDNWSLALDVYIMLRTFLPSTYRNAY